MPRALLLLSFCIIGLAILSLHLGIRFTPPAQVWAALTGDGQDAAALIVRRLRVPRMVLALAVGAALGLAGLLMQTATRNPVAEPGLLGVNAGAALGAVLVLTLAPVAGMAPMMGGAALGALAATLAVFALVRAVGPAISPIHMLLGGVAVSALLATGLQVLILMDEAVMEALIFWLAGGFADRPLTGLAFALPLVALAFAATLLLAPLLDVLMTDDATAATLGARVGLARIGALTLAALLAGSSVAMAGPVAFVGLIAPHLARLTGAEGHRQLVPLAALWGMALAMAADILARFVLYPTEAPVGAVMALFGVPLLIMLLRRARLGLA